MARGSNEPDDAIRVWQLLDSMGVEEYDPRVVHQLLDFMYGYVSGVLQDAEAYGERAGMAKGVVEVEDVLTAIQSRAAFSFVHPPSQDVLASLAEKRNAQPLPELGKAHGLRLPPEDSCLTAPMWGLPRPSASAVPVAAATTGLRAPQAAAARLPGAGRDGGPADMEVDGAGGGGGGAYPWPAAAGLAGQGAEVAKGAAGGGARKTLDVNPGEAPDD